MTADEVLAFPKPLYAVMWRPGKFMACRDGSMPGVYLRRASAEKMAANFQKGRVVELRAYVRRARARRHAA